MASGAGFGHIPDIGPGVALVGEERQQIREIPMVLVPGGEAVEVSDAHAAWGCEQRRFNRGVEQPGAERDEVLVPAHLDDSIEIQARPPGLKLLQSARPERRSRPTADRND